MKKLLTSLALVLGLTTVVACSNEAQTEQTTDSSKEAEDGLVVTINEPVSIEFWHAMAGTNQEAVDALVEQFNSSIGSEKGITVKPVYQGAYNDLKTKTSAALKSGSAPAIAQAYPDWVAEFLQSGAVVALDEYINNEEVGITDFDDIIESYRAENSQYEGGKFYSLPFNKSTEVLYYNKTFFEENGLQVPTTWDEVEAVSAQITALTGNPAFGHDSAQNYFITMVQQFGGEYTNSQGEVLFSENNSQAAIDALALMKRNVDAGYWRLAGEDKCMSGPFMSNLVQMYIGSSAGYSHTSSADFEVGVAPIPQISEETGAVIQQGTNVVVFNQNKTPEEVYAAYEFAKFLSSYEGNLYFSTTTSYLPIRQSVIDSAEYQEYIVAANDQTKVVGPSQSKYFFYDPSFFTDTFSSYNVRQAVGQAVEQVVLNGVSPEQAVQDALNQLK